jgi:hypothetical protein
MRKLALVVVVLALLGSAVPAGAGIITFEGYVDMTAFTTQYLGVNFNGATVLSKGGSLNYTQFPPHSGINVVYNPSGAMTIDFLSPVGFFSGYFTYNLPLSVRAFDGSLNLLGSYNGLCSANYVGSGCATGANEYGLITAAGISRVIITGGGGNNFTLDDAEFTGSVDNNTVPDPGSTLLLLSMALAGVGAWRLRRQ